MFSSTHNILSFKTKAQSQYDLSKLERRVHSCPTAAVSSHHKPSDPGRHTFTILHLRRPEARDGSPGAGIKVSGGICAGIRSRASSGFWGRPVAGSWTPSTFKATKRTSLTSALSSPPLFRSEPPPSVFHLGKLHDYPGLTELTQNHLCSSRFLTSSHL